MKLKEYLRINRIDPVTFAVKSGISVSTIYRYLSGEKPSFNKAVLIEKATNGQISIEDLRGNE